MKIKRTKQIKRKNIKKMKRITMIWKRKKK